MVAAASDVGSPEFWELIVHGRVPCVVLTTSGLVGMHQDGSDDNFHTTLNFSYADNFFDLASYVFLHDTRGVGNLFSGQMHYLLCMIPFKLPVIAEGSYRDVRPLFKALYNMEIGS